MGSYYWLADDVGGYARINYVVRSTSFYEGGDQICVGVRPVVELNDGVYIAIGTGVAGDPYILGKE